MKNEPTYANGKICYLEIPAIDIPVSVAFYEAVFGWRIRRRGDGNTAFDDGAGEVSGTWVKSRKPYTEPPGLIVHIMIDDIQATMEAIKANGGTIVQPVGMDAPEITAHFRDPAGNVFGIYQPPA